MGGISYRESHLAMEMLEEANIITSAEFVEVNPILDEKNKTATVAVALMGSLIWRKTYYNNDAIQRKQFNFVSNELQLISILLYIVL